ncbi:MAG: hypothetical protein AB1757_25800 [Acidobacteriota bacterium]
MNAAHKVKIFGVIALLGLFILSVPAQWDKKPYTEWSEKDATKLLNDSPWGQTQTATDTSGMTGVARADSSQSRISDVTQVQYRIRLFSSKPIRQAISRTIELQLKDKLTDDMKGRLKALASADFPDYVVVTVVCESPTANSKIQEATAALYKFATADLKNNTYLLTKGGNRVFLQEYQAPRNDGFGARFIFPRLVNGEAYVTANSGELLFHSELPKLVELNMRFKVKEMMFGGKLEY